MELFLPVLSPEERRQLLIDSGVEQIDESESKEIVDVRKSRQFCGCKCKSAQACQQSTCSCFANGIPCQIDKIRFPCACNIKRCKNPAGLKRFNQVAVLKHYEKALGEENRVGNTAVMNCLSESELNDNAAAANNEETDDNCHHNQENAVKLSSSSSSSTSLDHQCAPDSNKKRKLLTTVNLDINNDDLSSSSYSIATNPVSPSSSSLANENNCCNFVGTYPDSPRLKKSITTTFKLEQSQNKKSKRKSHQPKKISN